MTEFELTEFGTVRLEKGGETGTGVAEVGREDGEVCKEGHVPRGQNGEGIVVEGDFKGAKRGEANAHVGFRVGRVAE